MGRREGVAKGGTHKEGGETGRFRHTEQSFGSGSLETGGRKKYPTAQPAHTKKGGGERILAGGRRTQCGGQSGWDIKRQRGAQPLHLEKTGAQHKEKTPMKAGNVQGKCPKQR